MYPKTYPCTPKPISVPPNLLPPTLVDIILVYTLSKLSSTTLIRTLSTMTWLVLLFPPSPFSLALTFSPRTCSRPSRLLGMVTQVVGVAPLDWIAFSNSLKPPYKKQKQSYYLVTHTHTITPQPHHRAWHHYCVIMYDITTWHHITVEHAPLKLVKSVHVANF